jgi:hypothetical protein
MGISQERLRDFVSLSITNLYDDIFPATRPFFVPIVQPTNWQFDTQSGQTRMRLSGHWDAAEFHDWLEQLLPRPK